MLKQDKTFWKVSLAIFFSDAEEQQHRFKVLQKTLNPVVPERQKL